MLKFRVRDIPAEGLHREIDLGPSWFVSAMHGIEGNWVAAAATVALTLSRSRAEVLARGEIAARLRVPCARCLEPAAVEVKVPFTATFVPAGAARGEAGEYDDPDFQSYSGDEIDLSELVREQIILGIPYSPLCRPDCLGLCPQCGAELNQGSCDCRPAAEPRGHAPRVD